MKKPPQLLIAMTVFLAVSSIQAKPSDFISPEESAALNKKQTTPPVNPPLAETANTVPSIVGYLGIGFDTVPASIRAHLPNNISPNQGLIVTRFADKSSAADDGLKVYDVLLNYDGEPIIKPEDFLQKIRQDKPGRLVKFTIMRQGQILTVPVTMGAQKNKTTVAKMGSKQIPNLYQFPSVSSAPNANFNGLAIRRIGQDTYDASIGFIAQNGKSQRRSYKGNRMQILQQIMQDRSLPLQAKQQLLFAVQPRQKPSNNWNNWGWMPNMPFGNGNNFNPNQFFKGFGW